jgi:hypothetical protein
MTGIGAEENRGWRFKGLMLLALGLSFGLATLSYPQQRDVTLHQRDQGRRDLMDHLITTLVSEEAGYCSEG